MADNKLNNVHLRQAIIDRTDATEREANLFLRVLVEQIIAGLQGGEQIKINGLGISGTSHIVFVIGGSLGLHHSVSDRADYKLSFSKMTYPHQLMRVILLEQIYRSYRIIHNEPYHK